MYAVLVRSRADDDTEELYRGKASCCRVYVRGWVDALLSKTAYHQVIEDGIMIFRSPLVSEDTLHLWIEQIPEEVLNDARVQ